jgi:urease accessory protein
MNDANNLNLLTWLRLMQLADSALPIGATAHSFGLESLVDSRIVTVRELPTFFADYLSETGTLEAVYCRAAHHLTVSPTVTFAADWSALNDRLGALKTARESRTASLTLGRRFMQLVLDLDDQPLLREAARISKQNNHHCAAFGLVAGVLAVPVDLAVAAYLQQSIIGLISACQRLLPLGQSAASRLLWELKPALLNAVEHSQTLTIDTVSSFTPLIDLASMRHPLLETRLFIS